MPSRSSGLRVFLFVLILAAGISSLPPEASAQNRNTFSVQGDEHNGYYSLGSPSHGGLAEYHPPKQWHCLVRTESSRMY